MKIAIVALPARNAAVITPPLSLGYVAALLEQQRHIVRIYDLALSDSRSPGDMLAPVRAFRPHMIVVATDDLEQVPPIQSALADCNAGWLTLNTSLRGLTPGQSVNRAAWRLELLPGREDDQTVIIAALLALRDDLDTLPFPARHLLQLEQYPLHSSNGSLQTTVLVGQECGQGEIRLRNPRLIASELRSVIHDHGIWHIVFSGPPLTHDSAWLHDFLYGLIMARLGVEWEGSVQYQALTPDLLQMFRRAGCDALRFELDIMHVLDSREAREALSAAVRQAHAQDIKVHADIMLEPRYSSIPAVVDMSATFGLDDARFSVQQPLAVGQPPIEQSALAHIIDMAEERYRALRSRQFFIKRFGNRLGPMIWKVGRTGLLGPAWQRQAAGVE